MYLGIYSFYSDYLLYIAQWAKNEKNSALNITFLSLPEYCGGGIFGKLTSSWCTESMISWCWLLWPKFPPGFPKLAPWRTILYFFGGLKINGKCNTSMEYTKNWWKIWKNKLMANKTYFYIPIKKVILFRKVTNMYIHTNIFYRNFFICCHNHD